MSLDLTIDRSKEDVTSAIYEFAARRGLSATTPWYLDGIRIEDTRAAADAVSAQPEAGGVWAQITGFLTPPAPGPVVSIELSRRKKQTRVVMSLGAHRDSVALGQALRTYLQDTRAYDVHTPLTCSRCSAQIVHFIARYCGRCGLPLGSAMPPIAMPQAQATLPPLPDARWTVQTPERATPVAAREPAVSIEREEIVIRQQAAEVVPPQRTPPVVEAPSSVVAADEAASKETPAASPTRELPEPKRERAALAEPATEAD